MITFSYQNNINELNKLADDLTSFELSSGIPHNIIYGLHLCLDEILTNIISYGIKNKPNETISLSLNISNHTLIATVSDHGTPFDPLHDNSKKLDIASQVEDRPIGGLGLYFLQKYMDSISYSYQNNHNIITLTKSLPS